MMQNMLKVMVAIVYIVPHISFSMDQQASASSSWFSFFSRFGLGSSRTAVQAPDEGWTSIDLELEHPSCVRVEDQPSMVYAGVANFEESQDAVIIEQEALGEHFEELQQSIIPLDPIFVPTLAGMSRQERHEVSKDQQENPSDTCGEQAIVRASKLIDGPILVRIRPKELEKVITSKRKPPTGASLRPVILYNPLCPEDGYLCMQNRANHQQITKKKLRSKR
jgi:hypothetical protein